MRRPSRGLSSRQTAGLHVHQRRGRAVRRTNGLVGRSPLGPSVGANFPPKDSAALSSPAAARTQHPTTPKSPGAVAHSFEFATRQLIQTLIPQTRTLCTLKLQLNTFCTNTPKVQEFRANILKAQVQVENEMKFKTYSLEISATLIRRFISTLD